MNVVKHRPTEFSLVTPALILCNSSTSLYLQISGEYAVKSDRLRPLYDSIKRSFVGVTATHVLRKDNADADLLANVSQDALEIARNLMECRDEDSGTTLRWLTRKSLNVTAISRDDPNHGHGLLPDLLVRKMAEKQPLLVSALTLRSPSSISIEEVMEPANTSSPGHAREGRGGSVKQSLKSPSGPRRLPGATIVVNGGMYSVDLSEEMVISQSAALRIPRPRRASAADEPLMVVAGGGLTNKSVILARLMVHMVRLLVNLITTPRKS